MTDGADDLVVVGRVGRPHGIDGSFVVERPSADEARFAVGAMLLAGGETAEVVASKRVGGGRRAIRLDRAVERGTELMVRRADLPPAGEDAYYVFQLVGLAVEEEGGRALGRVRGVLPGPANDALELESGLLLPMVEDCIRAVDLEHGRVLVARGFAEDG